MTAFLTIKNNFSNVTQLHFCFSLSLSLSKIFFHLKVGGSGYFLLNSGMLI